MDQMKNIRWLFNGLAILTLILMLPGSALASPGDGETTVTVSRYRVSLAFVEPAKAGMNSLHVTILDEMGMPVSNARVEINAVPVKDTDEHEDNMQHNAPANGYTDPTVEPVNGLTGPTHGMEPDHAVEEAADDVHPVEEVMDDGHAAEEADDGHAAEETDDGHAAEETDDEHEIEAVTAILVAEHGSGEYAGQITFSNTGHWMLTVQISIDGESLEAEFPVEVTGGSPSGGILAGFAGLNAALIGVAAITRRKPASA
jgi:hypothetical protein